MVWRRRHTAQEGDAFSLLEMNVLWVEKCKSIPEQQQRTLWRCWRKQVQNGLYPQANESYIDIPQEAAQQGRSYCSKTAIKKAILQFGDKDPSFWRNVLWSDETKIELFGHNDHCYVWREKGEAFKPKNTIMLWGCFAAGGSGAPLEHLGRTLQGKSVCNLKWYICARTY